MSALERLMDQVGIELGFRDAAGSMQQTSPEVARGLLKALGIEAADEGEAQNALASLVVEETRQILPPVVVTTVSGETLRLPVRIPDRLDSLRWETREEGGTTRGGDVPIEELDPLESPTVEHSSRRCIAVDAPVTLGYHQLQVEGDGLPPIETRLIVAPERCWVPEGLGETKRLWGISIQLYLLRSKTNWGIGDFGDLKRFVEIMADLGASVVGLNPLHAMFLDDPEHASPYSPASRLFLNVLYVDVTAVPGFDTSLEVRMLVEHAAFQDDLAASRDAPLVDHNAVARLKLPVLETLYSAFCEAATDEDRGAFAAFRREQGEALERFCRFQALREHFATEAPDQADWRRWPVAFRDAGSSVVERFAQEHRYRIEFFAWLQWTADRQLGDAAATAAARGMEIGLYRDLAVGANGSGAEGWSNPSTVLSSVHIGAPPDVLSPSGQDWGLPAFDPRALREEAYAGFVELLRANMRHAGGLRIDHVMALQHLYLIPEGRPPTEGAYVGYPMEDLISVLALESQRQCCLVVGEDLGTVPEGFRDRMAAAGILSYRVVFFERKEDGNLIAPQGYPALALAVLGSHDLATLRGWWEGHDIALRAELDLYPRPEEEARQRSQRKEQRLAFIEALVQAHLLEPAEVRTDAPFDEHLAEAAHAFLAQTSSGLAVVQLDDLLQETEQVNLPGTADQYPNWRRKNALSIEEIAGDLRIRDHCSIMSRMRQNANAPDNNRE